MHLIASFPQLLGKEITLPASGNLPLVSQLTVLDGLDGVMNNDMLQVGAAGKGIEANLLQPLGNVDGLEGFDVLKGVVLDFLDIIRKMMQTGFSQAEPTATWSLVIFTPSVTSTPFLKNFTPSFVKANPIIKNLF